MIEAASEKITLGKTHQPAKIDRSLSPHFGRRWSVMGSDQPACYVSGVGSPPRASAGPSSHLVRFDTESCELSHQQKGNSHLQRCAEPQLFTNSSPTAVTRTGSEPSDSRGIAQKKGLIVEPAPVFGRPLG